MGGRTRRALKKSKSKNPNAPKSSTFSKIIKSQHNRCWYCGESLTLDCTKEHLLAKALGGTDDVENIKAAHADCNSAAGHLTVAQKHRLRKIGLTEGRNEMLHIARRLRRAQQRRAFSSS